MLIILDTLDKHHIHFVHLLMLIVIYYTVLKKFIKAHTTVDR